MDKMSNATKCLIDKMSNFFKIYLNFVYLETFCVLDILSIRHFVALAVSLSLLRLLLASGLPPPMAAFMKDNLASASSLMNLSQRTQTEDLLGRERLKVLLYSLGI